MHRSIARALRTVWGVRVGVCLGATAIALTTPVRAADAAGPAVFTITTNVVRPAVSVPPLGVNGWGGCGAVEWAANNFIQNSGNEPVVWRNLHRVKACGPGWFEIDGPGTSWYDLWNSGFLSGADLRIYRLVNKDGQRLPVRSDGGNLELATADHVAAVGKGRVIPEGDKDFPDGGWVASTYAPVFPNAWVRHGNLTATDAAGVENGKTYWYTVVAVTASNVESDLSPETNATPEATAEAGPHLIVATADDQAPPARPGADFDLAPKVVGGQAPFTWRSVDGVGRAAALPAGLRLDVSTGRVTGRPEIPIEDVVLRLQVTDMMRRSDARNWVINPAPPHPTAAGLKPLPPTDLKAEAGKGCVTLTWEPSPSPGVVGYRVKRSTVPAARQAQRVYVTRDTPPLAPWDYVTVERRFDPFLMRYVNPRVRGMSGSADVPEWYWQKGGVGNLVFALVPHPKPVPAAMVDPGETCLQIKAGPGAQSIFQYTFIGTQEGGESLWYGQLEPGKSYRVEAWMRQEALAGDGVVTFSFGKGYSGLKQTFKVTGEWAKYTGDFVGPARPEKILHFGPQFAFTGPGTLWLDNARVFRCDRPEAAERPYVPNATVLDELLRSQPAAGPKGAHRIWFLDRNATMASLLSWHANSRVNVDWRTDINATTRMTVPMGLMFDLETGPDAASRMRPWLVMQHILHSEADWLAFVEYLAAPYDPASDTPQTRPWAYKRFQQRGTGTPWTDEFPGLIIEFGNETWHNGVFPDWLGFSTRNSVHQGGKEYGLFTRYLCETIMKSPYWRTQHLDRKIRFALGGNYDGGPGPDGSVHGYGEEALQANPYATLLGHANYVGPKWETGDYSARRYDDHGVQECLLSFLTGPEAGERQMGAARDALASAHHVYDIAAYEGGPGGFALPGKAGPEQVETNEKYGKSLAQAVGAFDAWMRSYRYGWTEQCFFSYGEGSHWNSHTVLADGFRPVPAWLALTLRNRYASGDLMAVEATGVPELVRGKASYPLAGAYAMRDGTRWTVFVVSRRLDGNHDGQDFGDGCTPVTLALPFGKAGRITLHTLTGDPRQTNRDALNVTLQSRDLPVSAPRNGTLAIDEQSGGTRGGMPPGSIFAYVFEDTAGK